MIFSDGDLVRILAPLAEVVHDTTAHWFGWQPKVLVAILPGASCTNPRQSRLMRTELQSSRSANTVARRENFLKLPRRTVVARDGVAENAGDVQIAAGTGHGLDGAIQPTARRKGADKRTAISIVSFYRVGITAACKQVTIGAKVNADGELESPPLAKTPKKSPDAGSLRSTRLRASSAT